MTAGKKLFFLCAASLMLTAPVVARIFKSRPASGARAIPGLDSGWSLVQNRMFTVNGVRAGVEVLGSDDGLERLEGQWRSAQARGGAFRVLGAGDGAVFGEVFAGGVLSRVLAVRPPGPWRSAAVAVHIEPAGAARGAIADTLPHFPALAGGQTLFCAIEDNGRCGVELRRVPGSPSAVLRTADYSLSADGWRMLIPSGAADFPPSGGMALYVRGDEMMCVLARDGPERGACDVTAMYRVTAGER